MRFLFYLSLSLYLFSLFFLSFFYFFCSVPSGSLISSRSRHFDSEEEDSSSRRRDEGKEGNEREEGNEQGKRGKEATSFFFGVSLST